MKRREFILSCGGLFVMSQLPAGAKTYGDKKLPDGLRDVRKITIPVGATTPFKALHISDSHLTWTDSRDNERKLKLGEKRMKIFPDAEYYFNESLRYAGENGMILLHTGDLIDFVSDANLEYVASRLSGTVAVTAAGNHEYSQYVGEAKEDAAYKAQSYDKVQMAYPNDLTFASYVMNGVNFVAVDDVYYNFTDHQRQLMKKEVRKGLPIVLMCHVPLYTPEHCAMILKSNKGKGGYMTGAPLEITETYVDLPDLKPGMEWKNRRIQQRADKPTLRFVEWLKKQPELKAILCGHTHGFYQERFSPTAIQYTVGPGYKGSAYEIEFI